MLKLHWNSSSSKMFQHMEIQFDRVSSYLNHWLFFHYHAFCFDILSGLATLILWRLQRKTCFPSPDKFALFSTLSFGQQAAPRYFDGKSWWDHVKVLLSTKMEGRDTGSAGKKAGVCN